MPKVVEQGNRYALYHDDGQLLLLTRSKEVLERNQMSLVNNINKRRKAGTSRSKKNSTISPKAYADMKAGWPKKKKSKKKKT